MIGLSAGRPSTNPKDDLFGHARFSNSSAESICRYPGSGGPVLALYGPWGSGKSRLLSCMSHYLEQQPEGSRSVIVTFNPWCFSEQENISSAFLGQLQAVPPTKSEKLKELGNLLGNFAEGVGPAWLEKCVYRGLRTMADRPATGGCRTGHGPQAVDQFPKEFEMIKAGKNLGGTGAFGDFD